MKNEQFDSWLKAQSEKNMRTFDSELEWQLLEPKLPKKKKDRRYFFILFFAGLLGLGGVSHFYFKNNSNTTISTLSNNKVNTNHEKKSTVFDKNILNSTTELKTIETDSKADIQSKLQANSNKSSNSIINNEISSSNKIKKNFLSTANEVVNNTLKNLNEASQYTSENIDIHNTENNTISEPIELDKLRPKHNLIAIGYNNNLINQFPTLKIKKKNKINYNVFIQGQYSLVNQSISGNKEIAALRNHTENGIDRIAIFSGIQIDYKNKFFIRSGFEIGVTTIQFRHQYYDTTIIQTQQETLSVTTHEDLSQTYEIGTTSKKQISYINKNKYNHRRQFNIPLFLGYSTHLTTRLGIQYNGGLILPVIQSFEGEVISNTSNKLNAYGSGVKNFLGPCSVQGGIEVVYHVFKGIDIYSGFNYRTETKPWLDASTATYEKHKLWLFSLGINYKIH